MIRSLKVNTASLKRWCDVGFLAATELADYLAGKGVPFRSAHGVVREIVRYCREKGVKFDQLSIGELRRQAAQCVVSQDYLS
jgi:argininosuccinate lyase